MNTVLWVIAGLLALVFLGSGAMKLIRSRAQLQASGLGWVESYSDNAVRAIGALEVLAAIGLILPALLDIAPILVPLAATGLALIMIGAMVTHGRRKEYPLVAGNAVLLILAVIVAWGRFGPYAF